MNWLLVWHFANDMTREGRIAYEPEVSRVPVKLGKLNEGNDTILVKKIT